MQGEPRFSRRAKKKFLTFQTLNLEVTYARGPHTFCQDMPKEAKKKKASAPKMPSKKELQPHTLSTEYIQDSESEDNDTSATNSTSNDDSLPENQATSVSNKNKQTKIQVSESSSSSGSQSESESEDESEDESESSQDSDQAHSEADKKQQAVDPDRQR
jgi:hypothetical protein